MNAKYLNPYTDFGFKKLFGEEASKPLLIDFLNSLLPIHHHIQDLDIKNGEQLGHNIEDRRAIYDIYCQSTTGERFIVELQQSKQVNYKERTLFYATSPIQAQAQKGRAWEYNLKAVYCISIMNFVFDELDDIPNTDVVHTIKLKDQNNRIFYDKLTFIYLEMPKFKLDEQALLTQQDKWLFFIKNLKDLQVIPMILQNNDVFEKAFATAELARMSQEEWDKYQYSLKTYRDNYAIDQYRQKQYGRGMEKGFAKGMEQGLEKGLEQGLEQGIYQGKLDTARQLKGMGLSLDTIMQATGLTANEIENLG